MYRHMATGIVEEQHSADPFKPTRSERLALQRKLSSSWRLKLGHLMESHHTHALVLLLIFADVAMVLCEVMVREVCPLPAGGFPTGSWQYQRINGWGEGLSWASRSILLLLLAHQLGLMAAFGRLYFLKVAYVIDLIIVSVALALETAHLVQEQQHGGSHRRALSPAEDHGSEGGVPDEATNLVIVLLVWRILRVVHGFTVTSIEHADDSELKEANAKVAELEAELARVKAEAGLGGKAAGAVGEGAGLTGALARSPSSSAGGVV